MQRIPTETGGADPAPARDGLLRPFERLCAGIAACCILAMMSLTFVQVVWRYFLATPINGGEEVQSFLLGFTIFTALPVVTRAERHIAVRSLASLLRGRARLVQRRLVLAGTVAGLAFIAFLLFDQAQSMRAEGTLTNFLDMPVAPSVYVFAGLAAVAALMALGRLVRHSDEATQDAPAGVE